MKSRKAVLLTTIVVAIGALIAIGNFNRHPVQALDIHQQKLAALKAYEDAQRETAVSVPYSTLAPRRKPTQPAKPEPAPLASGSGVRIADQITSRWFVDYIPEYGGTVWNGVYIFAMKHSESTNAAFVFPYKDAASFAPRAVGDITITDVTGLDGIVTFTTSSGVSGRFDMATQEWTLGDSR